MQPTFLRPWWWCRQGEPGAGVTIWCQHPVLRSSGLVDRLNCCLGLLEKTHRQITSNKVCLQICVDAFSRLRLFALLIHRQRCLYAYCKAERTMPSWSCLCHAQCHVLSRVNICNKDPHILSFGSEGVWVVLRRPGTNWISGQHATIRVWSIFEGLFPPL